MTAETVRGAGTGLGRRTATTLADGRSLIYFDDAGAPLAHGRPDTRTPQRPARAGTMRFDVLTGEWVSLAAHRMSRTHLPSRTDCPLCPTTEPTRPTEVPDPAYHVAVLANRFPSFSADAEGPGADDGARLGPPDRPAGGRCEVICFSSDHNASMTDLSTERMRTVVRAWADRTAELSQVPGVAQVFCFENRGAEIGVTLAHPHGQIYAYPYLTPRTEALIRQSRAHAERTGGNLLRDVLHAELAAGTRVVLRGEHWSAYVPVAARWPVEVHLAPHRDVPDLAALDAAERHELTVLYPELLRRVDAFFPGVDRVPYIAGWHQAPLGADRALGRLHLQVFSVLRAPGKLKYLAGSESGMGAWINDTTPERIVARLREVAR